ncbi:hypothetical protein COT30_04350 [Candidatus Micrarchaeota archaeon CG08_land_8_20_14_0_20_49_17]|nr:MAG: hypothetical protein COT30_04350 [Candidatus Micrarchaeota archaeon CG08_land_8_20_14_0_20_49_17]
MRVFYHLRQNYRQWQFDAARYPPDGVEVLIPPGIVLDVDYNDKNFSHTASGAALPKKKPSLLDRAKPFLNEPLKYNPLLINYRGVAELNANPLRENFSNEPQTHRGRLFVKSDRTSDVDADISYLYSGIVKNPKTPYVAEVENPTALTYFSPIALYNPLVKSEIAKVILSPKTIRILCLSEACKISMLKVFGQAIGEKLEVMYPVVPDLHLQTTDSGQPRFLFASLNCYLKGGREIILAAKRLKGKFSLTMVTDLPPELAPDAKKLGIGLKEYRYFNRMGFLNSIPDYDVILHPTFMDCFGLAPFECVCGGLAGIASGLYALPEFIQHGRNGWNIPAPMDYFKDSLPNLKYWFMSPEKYADYVKKREFPHVVDKLVEYMQYYIDNPGELKKHKEYSRKLAKEKFSLEVRNKKLLKIFEEGLGLA